jgi:hypothetical protein
MRPPPAQAWTGGGFAVTESEEASKGLTILGQAVCGLLVLRLILGEDALGQRGGCPGRAANPTYSLPHLPWRSAKPRDPLSAPYGITARNNKGGADRDSPLPAHSSIRC